MATKVEATVQETAEQTKDITAMGFFEATSLMRRIEAEAAETGELTEEQAAALVGVHAVMPEKVQELAVTLLRLEMFTDYLKREEERMYEARKRVTRIRERLGQAVIDYMEAEGIDKLTGGTYLLKPRKCPPSVVLDDGFDNPFFCRVVRIDQPSAEAIKAARAAGDRLVMQADKRAIKEALQAGQEIPGATLVQKVKLEIK